MRTAMPNVTCGRMTDCLPSATAESISTPRFIGPGCRTIASCFAKRKFFLCQPIILEIFLRAGKTGAKHALILQTQHHEHIHIFQSRSSYRDKHARPRRSTLAGSRVFGAMTRTSGTPERGKRMNLRARHPRVQNIADYGNPQAVKIGFVMANSEHIQQPLGRMRMPAIPGIDNMNFGPHMAGDQVRRTALRVPHDEHIGMHGREIVHGIQQCLAFGLRGGRNVEIDHIGRRAALPRFRRSCGCGYWARRID